MAKRASRDHAGMIRDDGEPRHVLKAPEPSPVDFRRLLKLYMERILRERGVTYVASWLAADNLTTAERAAISEINDKVQRENQ